MKQSSINSTLLPYMTDNHTRMNKTTESNFKTSSTYKNDPFPDEDQTDMQKSLYNIDSGAQKLKSIRKVDPSIINARTTGIKIEKSDLDSQEYQNFIKHVLENNDADDSENPNKNEQIKMSKMKNKAGKRNNRFDLT